MRTALAKKKKKSLFYPLSSLSETWPKLTKTTYGFFSIRIFCRRHQLLGRFFHHNQSSLMVWATASRQIQIPMAFEKALSSKRWRQWQSLQWENQFLRQPDNYHIKCHQKAMDMLTELCRRTSLRLAAMQSYVFFNTCTVPDKFSLDHMESSE